MKESSHPLKRHVPKEKDLKKEERGSVKGKMDAKRKPKKKSRM